MSWSCHDCGSTRLTFTLGPCAGCGDSLDGERSPASRTEGMFHRRCWNARTAAPPDSASAPPAPPEPTR